MGPWELAYAGVGSTVTMRSEFSDGQQAPVRAGPWYAYITPDTDIGGDRTEPMLLGPVHIADTGGYPYVATTTFVVPEVPTGSYWVNVCDLGCSHGVGDLDGGTIVLGATGSEAGLFARSRILTWMQEGDARTIRHLRVQRDQLRSMSRGPAARSRRRGQGQRSLPSGRLTPKPMPLETKASSSGQSDEPTGGALWRAGCWQRSCCSPP